MKTKFEVEKIDAQSVVPIDASAVFDSDRAAIAFWLEIFKRRSPHTYRAYKKEANRWMALLDYRHGESPTSKLQMAREDDVEAFLLALGRPGEFRNDEDEPFLPLTLPPAILARHSIRSQPFLKEHSTRSMLHALSSISSLYKTLATPIDSSGQTYIRHNPTARLSKMQDRTVTQTDRHFTPRVYHEMLQTIAAELTKARTPLKRRQQIRRKWIVVLIYGLWLRIAEATTLSMSSFKKSNDVWTVTILGKGRKERTVVVTSEVIEQLREYRTALALPPLSARMEKKIPAIGALTRLNGDLRFRHCNTSSIYREIKSIAFETARRLEGASIDLAPAERDHLIQSIEKISPHWFRHSGATEAISEGFPIVDAAARIGHADINTTRTMYYHGERKKSLDALEQIEANRKANSHDFLN